MKKKFTIIKNDDVLQYLNNLDRKDLIRILEKIQKGRKRDCKNTDHTYLVVNLDEPYAEEVIEIMEKNGHWG